MRFPIPAVLLLAAAVASAQPYDVVVVSGSSGGFEAALAAGRMGVKVALIEDTPTLGGMLSSGISNIDTYSYHSLSGIFEEFRLRVKAHYASRQAADPIFRLGTRANLLDFRPRQSNAPEEGGRWEPHVADEILKSMIASLPNIHIFYGTWATGVLRQRNRVTGVVTENKRGERRTVTGQVIIDATHEGDIAAWAGVPYRVGREARSPQEPHAGDIWYFNGAGEIMDGSTGRQDRAIVSYGIRLCIQHYPPEAGNRHLLTAPPPGYDRTRYVHTTYTGELTMPGNKAEMNANPLGNEMQEINWEWPEASRARRQELYRIYRNHALGFLYFLQHERGLKHLGLAQDEFKDNGNIPYRMFVREARRIEGEATMTESDINPFLTSRGLIPKPNRDSIAIGHYPLDSKPVRAKTDMSTPEKGNGDFFLANVTTPFQVPYGAIVPKGVDGLLVPVAMSATHVAFSAVRMDPTWMAMGQAAGCAAALSIRNRTSPRDLNVAELQRELIRQKVRLMFYWDVPLDHPDFAAIQWLTVSKGLAGYPDRLFRPNQALTRAELAVAVARVFDLWPSVSNFHFTDVAWNHWAFREIETLYDHGLWRPLGFTPRWVEAGGYDPVRNAGFQQGRELAAFEPGKAVAWREFTAVVNAVQKSQTVSPGTGVIKQAASLQPPTVANPDREITRGEAATFLAALP